MRGKAHIGAARAALPVVRSSAPFVWFAGLVTLWLLDRAPESMHVSRAALTFGKSSSDS